MIYCILDACSYIYLSNFKFILDEKEISLFEILTKTKFMTIRHSSTIGDEIKRNFKVSAAEALKINSRNYSFSKYSIATFDELLFNGSISATTADRGEKENVCVAIDLFKDKKYSIIYLTDDKRAIGEKGHLADVAGAFPYFKVWSSFDVVLFLYFHFNSTYLDYEKATASLRDLNTSLYKTKFAQLRENRIAGITVGQKYEKKLAEIQNETKDRLSAYITKINIIRNLIAA